ncbi:arylamine N-acetyltransferase [Streptomyces sp. H27-C3]|uniref:arylamine N-acetyltransferase family protein n=1 Tax=Streptomyces sp. H27-C3 TaxID=3046305 RepID=UPI0024B8B7EF|nr:arylamine N-acetyltransferase [Streptomyces sp. H27-C3]MDJ0465386.1 arylamine N-acetyltransferase [Streptomyces sp. H27-C3]
MWNGDALDLDAYLTQLGYEGDRAPTLETLRALHRAHVLSVRWENLDAFLRGDVPLDLGALQAKMIGNPRGGYCFEHVSLYAAALERLGFAFFGIQGRIHVGPGKILPATHAMLVIELDGRRWLCDVGFGASPLEPIEITDRTEATDAQSVWSYLLLREEVTPGADGWTLYQPVAGGGDGGAVGDGVAGGGVAGGGWQPRHTFTLDRQYLADYSMANHFIATSSHSPFTGRLFVQRVFPDRLQVMDDRTLTTVRPGADSPPEVRELEAAEVPKALADDFGIELTEADAELLVAKLSTRHGVRNHRLRRIGR